MLATFKPKRRAFIDFTFISDACGTLMLLLLAFLGWRCVPNAPSWFLAACLVLAVGFNLYTWITVPVAYRKREYVLEADRILERGGGLFSSYERELLVKNITHVELILPWIEHRLYGTGNIRLQSAGGGGVEINMSSMEAPHQLHKQILDLLRTNGFALTHSELLATAQPAKVGVLLDAFLVFVMLSFFAAGFVSWFVETFHMNTACLEFAILCGFLISMIVLVTVYALGAVYKHFQLYNDMISVDQDFWGITQTLIPMENLTDSILQQGLSSRLCGLHNLTLSCQGGEHEITFSHLPDGPRWKSLLDEILQQRAHAGVSSATSTDGTPSAPDAVAALASSQHKRANVRKVGLDTQFTAELKMTARRLVWPAAIMLVTGILLLVGGISCLPTIFQNNHVTSTDLIGVIALIVGGAFVLYGLLILLGNCISLKCFRYKIKPTSFERNFQFITSKHVEFQAEKITGVIVCQDLLDRFCKTCTIDFWSIGSHDRLSFVAVPYSTELINQVLAKVGIKEHNECHRIQPAVSLRHFWGAHLFSNLVWLLVLLSTCGVALLFFHNQTPIAGYALLISALGMLLLMVISYLVQKLQYNFLRIDIFDDHLRVYEGVIGRRSTYVHFEDIKYIASTCYPFSDECGDLILEVSGEQVIKRRSGKLEYISNRVKVGYISPLRLEHLALDLLFHRMIELSQIPTIAEQPERYIPEPLTTAKPYWQQHFGVRLLPLFLLDIILAGALVYWSIDSPADVPAGVILTCALPLLVGLNVLYIILLRLYVNSISYVLDTQKVIKRWGVFYQKQLGIHFTDIDFIGKGRNFLNHLFDTGNITINTVGSRKTELVLSDLKDFEKFYQLLKEHYQGE